MAGNVPAAQQPLKTNIRRITNHLIKAITGMGFDIFIAFSRHSVSRYLEVYTGLRVYIVRISDHPLYIQGRYDYDIYTDRPRRGAKDYIAFLELFSERVRPIGSTNHDKMP
jgi:hypothetical protein